MVYFSSMTKIQWLVPVFGILLGWGCGHKDTRPSDVLQPEVMQQVLHDIHLMESDAMVQDWSNDSVKATVHDAYRVIFATYDITEDDFFTSLEWYEAHPKELEQVYEQLHEQLLLESEDLY